MGETATLLSDGVGGGAGTREDFFDDGSLSVGVVLHILPRPLRQLTFATLVKVAVCIVVAQPFAKNQ